MRRVYSVAFSPAGHTLAVGSSDSTVRLWDVADPVHPRTLGPVRASTGRISVESVAFSPDGHTLASGDDARDGPAVGCRRSRASPAARPAPDRRCGRRRYRWRSAPMAARWPAAACDGTVRLWDVADPAQPRPLGQPLTGSTAAVDSLAFSPDGHTLASGSGDGTTRLWNLNVQYAIDRICATAGRPHAPAVERVHPPAALPAILHSLAPAISAGIAGLRLARTSRGT